jgi:hypothetical protein
LIHSEHDENPTTSLADARQLHDAAKATRAKVLPIWMAPLGGHAGAYAAQPKDYAEKVIGFFRTYLVNIKDPQGTTSPGYPGYTPHYGGRP